MVPYAEAGKAVGYLVSLCQGHTSSPEMATQARREWRMLTPTLSPDLHCFHFGDPNPLREDEDERPNREANQWLVDNLQSAYAGTIII